MGAIAKPAQIAHILSMLIDSDHMKSSVAFLLHDTARLLRARFDMRARGVGVTRQQYRVLMLLARDDGPTQTEMADLLDVERITLCRMIDRLAEAGLVERRSDPGDRRVWRLHLLPAAHDIVQRLAAVWASVEAEAESIIGEDTNRLREDLLRLRDGLRDESKRSVA